MGPQCPSCGAIYEWTCGELEEQITSPKVYFCQECREMFILGPDEIMALQDRFRPALEESAAADAGDLGDTGHEDDDQDEDEEDGDTPPAIDLRPLDDRLEQAPPRRVSAFGLRERVVVTSGPHQGATGVVVVVDGGEVMLRIDGDAVCVRVSVHHVRRAA
jgi:predicted  nucleic acid-binding Zn-ribbon protein